jgi:hypothetical protein
MALAVNALHGQTWTAVLDDGTRLNVVASTKVGSFLVQTEFGLLRTKGEQVSLLLNGEREVNLLEPLRAMDYALWTQRLSERGHFQRLAAENPTPWQCASLLEALRPWGQRLDDLPLDTKRENRVRVLWQRLQKANKPQLALLVGALEVEISPTLGQHERRISLVEWRKALNSPKSSMRWAAARVAAVQQDANAELDLLAATLEDPSFWVAREAGRALYITDPAGATYRWAYEMVMSRKLFERRRGAMMLAEWSRQDPKTAQGIAKAMRNYGLLRQRNACGNSSTGLPQSGSEITQNSVLEITSPSALAMLYLADAIERVAKSAELPVPEPEGLPENPTQEDLQKAQAEAWRKVFMGR